MVCRQLSEGVTAPRWRMCCRVRDNGRESDKPIRGSDFVLRSKQRAVQNLLLQQHMYNDDLDEICWPGVYNKICQSCFCAITALINGYPVHAVEVTICVVSA
jgi:hypothetical protein